MESQTRPPTKKKRRQRKSASSSTGESDICEQVLDRCSKSVAPQHVKLCETARATRSFIVSKSLSPIPLSYFNTIIDTLSHASKKTHDAKEVSALSLLLEIVLPLVPEESITTSKAAKAVVIVVEGLQVSRVSALVNCLGVLLGFCDLSNWGETVELGFKTLIHYSMDKRQKVRTCAQRSAVKVFNYLECGKRRVKESASKSLLVSFQKCMSLALALLDDGSRSTSDGSSHSSALHLIDLLRSLIPLLRRPYIRQAIEALDGHLKRAKSPMVTRRVLDLMELSLGYFEGESDPSEICLMQIAEQWISLYTLVLRRMAGLLTSDEATAATRASRILQEKIINVSINADVEHIARKKASMMTSLWVELEKHLSTHTNEHSLAVVAALFLNPRLCSHTDTGNILVKVAHFMKNTSGELKKHFRKCIGCALVGMGPEKVLEVLPISVDAALSCSSDNNTWLIPILKDYVIGSSLGFFMETIVPLAESFQEACHKEENSVIRDQLESHARGCWALLPAFCRRPTDMHRNFGPLVDLMITYIKEADMFMLENIAIALQLLVKQNKDKNFVSDDEASKLWVFIYDEKTAIGNIKAMSTCSEVLLKAFTQRFSHEMPPAFVKETIRCLALLTEPLKVKAIFLSSLGNVSVDGSSGPSNKYALMLELASSFVRPATFDPDPDDFIYNSIEKCLWDGVEVGDAYAALYKVLVESSEFRSSKFEQVMDLLLGLKSPVDTSSLRLRFLCFRTLLIHSMETYCDGMNMHGNRILCQFIATPNDEQSRKVAGDILVETSSMLQTRTSASSKPGHHYVFVNMIMWFLLKTPPDITNAAVSVLSSLVFKDSNICYSVPDLVPAILELLDTEDSLQVIQAVLGFTKVLVSNLEVRDLRNFQSDIRAGLVPWSSVSQHDIKSQVTGILENMMQKCGPVLVSPCT